MADRGAVVAHDADDFVVPDDGFEHVMEPLADFGDQFIGLYFGPW